MMPETYQIMNLFKFPEIYIHFLESTTVLMIAGSQQLLIILHKKINSVVEFPHR